MAEKKNKWKVAVIGVVIVLAVGLLGVFVVQH